ADGDAVRADREAVELVLPAERAGVARHRVDVAPEVLDVDRVADDQGGRRGGAVAAAPGQRDLPGDAEARDRGGIDRRVEGRARVRVVAAGERPVRLVCGHLRGNCVRSGPG